MKYVPRKSTLVRKQGECVLNMGMYPTAGWSIEGA